MYVVVKEHLRTLYTWKDFADKCGTDLSKPFLVEQQHYGYLHKTWLLPATALTFVSTPLDKDLEDYL
jgi:hypothetical protein